MQGQMTVAADIVNFLSNEKPVFTLKSTATGRHFTYKITQGRFLSVLSGPDNTSDYQYAGVLVGAITQGKQVVTTRASRFTADSQAVSAVNWTFKRLWATGSVPDGVEFYHEGKCSHCGRMLTPPESVRTGIGPVCGARK